jgi:anthranilate phosphoribosyltransferase
MSNTFESLAGLVMAGQNLTFEQMQVAISQIMSGGCGEAQMATFLTALAAKGETVAELAGAAAAMRDNMTPIVSRHELLLDTCGTGGGGSTTFNISTTAALVIAAQGIPVAKHGNRSVTSRSGSADVLAGLGVNIEATVPQVERCLNELGICFCFAPLMHPAMKNVSAVRKQLGIRTIFNLLGPLANPAGAQFQLLGVGRPETKPMIASALAMLGTKKSFVVCGDDGLGEVTLATTTVGTEVTQKAESEFSWVPEDFGISRQPLDSITITNSKDSVAMVQGVLAGESSPARDIVILNAAAGFLVVGRCDNPRDAAVLAAESIDGGAATSLLQKLVRLSHEPA